ncbi:hypothetical protein [Alkalimarinus coralli]|nr:hypothetical protein [Alkalimarinus coralli]
MENFEEVKRLQLKGREKEIATEAFKLGVDAHIKMAEEVSDLV